MRLAVYIGGILGLALLLTLGMRADLTAMLHVLATAGASLLWLIPVRGLYLLLYAVGWFYLLRPVNPERRAGIGYLFWVTSVRDAVDRLLPVASVGGSLVGIHLLRWRGLGTAAVGASVIAEILLTLTVLYLFTAVGLALLLDLGVFGQQYRALLFGFLLSLPVPVLTALLLRYGSIFERVQRLLRPMLGFGAISEGAASLDLAIRACLQRGRPLLIAGALQFAALALGSFEIWFALHLFGHPVGPRVALALESMTQAVRHVAFIVPAGLGVQEAGLVLFGHVLGISSELAIAVSMAKRIREVSCGLPALISWQWFEGRKIHRTTRPASW